MAVTIDTRAQTKAKAKAAGAPPPVDLSDYAAPRIVVEGRKALAIWLAIPVVLVVMFVIGTKLQADALVIFAKLMLVWWLLIVVGYMSYAPRTIVEKLRKLGPEAQINSKTAPRLQNVLTKGPSMLGIEPVDGFIAPDSVPQARVGGTPYFFLTSIGARDLVSPPELDCLALHGLVHIRQGHARRLMLFKLLADTPPTLRILVWPVGIYATLLRIAWVDLADQTADRLTLLLIRNRDVLLGAIIKMHAATDPLMQDAEVTAKEVDAYIKQSDNVGHSGAEISTQFKMGSAIKNNPYLRGRIEALMEWSRSEEYKAALEQLASKAPTGAADVAGGTPAPRPASATPTR